MIGIKDKAIPRVRERSHLRQQHSVSSATMEF